MRVRGLSVLSVGNSVKRSGFPTLGWELFEHNGSGIKHNGNDFRVISIFLK